MFSLCSFEHLLETHLYFRQIVCFIFQTSMKIYYAQWLDHKPNEKRENVKHQCGPKWHAFSVHLGHISSSLNRLPRSVLISIFFACHVLKRWNVTDPLRGEFTGHRWNPLTKASDVELWCCLWSAPWINGWVSNRETGDLRPHRAHYDVIVMTKPISSIHLFLPVFIIVKNCFESTYCVHIWQMLSQLSCVKTCHI